MPILRSLNCSSESKENSYNPNILSITIVSVFEILSPMSLTIQQQLHNQRKRYHPNPPYLSLPTTDYHLQQLKKQPNKTGGSFAPSVVIPFHLPRAPFASLHTNPAWGRTKGSWLPLFFPPRDMLDFRRNKEQVYDSSERRRQPRSLPAHISRIPMLPPLNYSCSVLWDSLPILNGSLTSADQIAGCADVYWNGFYIQIGYDLKSLYNLFSGKQKIFPSLREYQQ